MSSILERFFREADHFIQRRFTPGDQRGRLEVDFVEEEMRLLDEPAKPGKDQPNLMYFGRSGIDPADTLTGVSNEYLEQLRQEQDNKS